MLPWYPGCEVPKRLFSIQYSVFFAIVTLSMIIDCKQLFYIIYYYIYIIIYNILSIQRMVTRAKKTEYWILNTFPFNRLLLCNMLIYIAQHSFRCRRTIEMRPIKHRACFLTKFQIVSVLQKIAPYHMPKFGSYRKSSYLCTGNRKNSLSCRKPVIYEDRSGA